MENAVKIIFDVNLNVNLPESVVSSLETIAVALSSKSAVKPEKKQAKAATVPAAPAAPAAPKEPETPAAPAIPEKPEEPKPSAPATSEAAEEPAQVSIEDLRAELQKKVTAHRAEIKAKLNALGAQSVTTLDPSNYTEMYEFLTSLS